MKVYLYDGIEYSNIKVLKTAIWRKTNRVFSEPKSNKDWESLGVVLLDKEPELSEEQLASQARAKRDRLLSACDYYVMPDCPATEEGLTEVKAYRQALRDITKQEGFPSGIVWPVVPEVLK